MNRNAPFPILPYSKQDYYWPDMKYGPYWPIQPRDFDSSTQSLSYTQFAATGTPEVPYAASGPWQVSFFCKSCGIICAMRK